MEFIAERIFVNNFITIAGVFNDINDTNKSNNLELKWMSLKSTTHTPISQTATPFFGYYFEDNDYKYVIISIHYCKLDIVKKADYTDLSICNVTIDGITYKPFSIINDENYFSNPETRIYGRCYILQENTNKTLNLDFEGLLLHSRTHTISITYDSVTIPITIPDTYAVRDRYGSFNQFNDSYTTYFKFDNVLFRCHK